MKFIKYKWETCKWATNVWSCNDGLCMGLDYYKTSKFKWKEKCANQDKVYPFVNSALTFHRGIFLGITIFAWLNNEIKPFSLPNRTWNISF